MNRVLQNLMYYVEHVISANEGGDDFAMSRQYVDALTTIGVLEKVGRGRWTITKDAEQVANQLKSLCSDSNEVVKDKGKAYE